MSAIQNLNQFEKSQVLGAVDQLRGKSDLLNVRYSASGTGNLVFAEGVKLVDLGASHTPGPSIVDKRSLDADPIEGVRIWDVDRAEVEPGSEPFVIARSGTFVWMEASAAISAGASVALVLASPGQVVTQTTEALLGKAHSKALASGDLILIEILADGT